MTDIVGRAERDLKRMEKTQKLLDESWAEIDRRGNGKSYGPDEVDPPAPIVACGSTIPPEIYSWVWEGWLAREMIQVIAGSPGCGKTTIALGLAATVTSGGRWPDGALCSGPGQVLMWSGEDHPAKTILPRFLAAGGDPGGLWLMMGVKEEGERREFSPASDMPMLLQAARNISHLDLVIVEPMIGAVAGDAHKNVEVRRALQPLLTLAEERKCAVLGITHFSKGTAGRDPVERVTGSVAFGAMARVVMAAARIHEDGEEERRVFCRAKSNIGPDTGGWEYSIAMVDVPGHIDEGMQAICVAWGKALEGQARDLLDQDPHAAPKSRLGEAVEFLKSMMGDSPSCLASEALESGQMEGHNERTMRRAAKTLGLLSVKRFDRRWEWRVPDNKADKEASPYTLSPCPLVPLGLSPLNLLQTTNSINVFKGDKGQGDNGTDSRAPPRTIDVTKGDSDSRHLLPLAALEEIPPDEPTCERLKVTILGKDGLCVTILTRSEWTLEQWKKFAWKHYDMFTSVVGQPVPEET